MKVISLIQPWASLMAVGAKRFETRSWPTPYRGDIAIAASAKVEWPNDEEFTFHALKAMIAQCADVVTYSPEFLRGYKRTLPLGQILCVVTLENVTPTETVALTDAWKIRPRNEEYFGNYAPNRFAWHCPNVRRLQDPIPWKGSQGLRDLPIHITAKINAQIL